MTYSYLPDFVEAEKQLCFTNKALEIAYYEHNFDEIVEKDIKERGLTSGDRAHHRASVIEANMWMVYKQVSRREGHEAGMIILAEKLECLNIFPRPGTVPFTTFHQLDIARYKKSGEWPVGACSDFRRRYGGSVVDVHDGCVRGFVTGAHGADADMTTQNTNTGRRMLVPVSRRIATLVEGAEEMTSEDITDTPGHEQSAHETPRAISIETRAEEQAVQTNLAADTMSEATTMQSNDKNETKEKEQRKRKAKKSRSDEQKAKSDDTAEPTTATPTTTVLTRVALTTHPLTGPTIQPNASSFGNFHSELGVVTEPNGPAPVKENRKQRRRRQFDRDTFGDTTEQAVDPQAEANTIMNLQVERPLAHVQALLPSPPASSPLDRKVLEQPRYNHPTPLQLADLSDNSLSRPPPPLLAFSSLEQHVTGSTGLSDGSGGLQLPAASICKSLRSPWMSDNKENVPPDITNGGADTTIFVEQQSPPNVHHPSQPAQLSDGERDRHGSELDNRSNGGNHDKGILVASGALEPRDSEPGMLERWRTLLREGQAIEQKNQYH